MSSAVKVPSVFDYIFYFAFFIKNCYAACKVELAIDADLRIS